MTSFYSVEELASLGLAAYGEDVRISRYARIYGAQNITLGSHVRIDDFCILSGRIVLGNYVHVSASTLLYGGEAGIYFHDFSTTSSRCGLYAKSDDYSGAYMTNPMVPEEYTGVYEAPVVVGQHVVIGSGCTIIPGVTVAEGCAVGAMTLLTHSTEPWGIYYGVPARRQRERKKDLLELFRRFQAETAD